MNSDAHNKPARGRVVLLIDDEQMVLDVGQAILQRLGHEVVTAQSGEEALDYFADHPEVIACVVLDLTMPGLGGKETYKRLRALSSDLPIIIASGLSAAQVAEQLDAAPETAIIQKPYQVADLSVTIQKMLQSDA
jgi:CheY-like chemotaxis protein